MHKLFSRTLMYLSQGYVFKGDKAVSHSLQEMNSLTVQIKNAYLPNNCKTRFE